MATQPTLAAAAAELEIPSIPDSWSRHWEAANAGYPGAEAVQFLQPDFIRHAAEYALLPAGKVERLLDAARQTAAMDSAARLAWLWHHLIFIDRIKGEPFGTWPMPAALGPLTAGLFPALVLLSGTPDLKTLHSQRGIPADVIAGTMWDVNNSMNIYERRNGRPGLGMRYMGWLMNHYRAELYRLGRLQFAIRSLGPYVYVYRSRKDGSIAALSAPGLVYRADGLIDGTNDRTDEQGRWTSDRIERDGRAIGHVISEDGFASRDTTALELDEWQLLMAPGDPVYDVHIPADGRLTAELFEESYARSVPFFRTYYPEISFKGYTCSSWLLDPQLKRLLPPDANIVQFQARYRLYPIGGGDDSFYNFLFDCNKCPVEQLPELSSMQRTVKRYMLDGGQMRAMGGFIPLP